MTVNKRTLGTLISTLSVLTLLATSSWSVSWPQGPAGHGARKAVSVAFSGLPTGPLPDSFQMAEVTFLAHSPGSPAVRDFGPANERGYQFMDAGVTVVLPREANRVAVRLCLYAADVTIEALNSVGNVISQQVVTSSDQCGDIVIEGEKVATVRFTGGGNEASIVWLSAEPSM